MISKPDQTEHGRARWLVESIALVILALALALVFRATVASAFEIPTPSMSPTIMVHDRVIAERISVHFSDPKPGDIVVFDDPLGGPVPLIKRVIAVSGQTVDVHDGSVWVNGARLNEPYTHGLPTEVGSLPLPCAIPNGRIWVMGDNRTNSLDSRYFGPVDVATVQARAVALYWPVSRLADLTDGD